MTRGRLRTSRLRWRAATPSATRPSATRWWPRHHAPPHHAPHRDLLDRMAPLLESVCGERDAAWSARVAAFFEAQEWDVGSFLDAVAAFAPALRGLGGAELPRTLAARLRTPLAPTAIARPWALAAQGAFDA